MEFSTIFIRRPVATWLLALGLLLSGVVAYRFLPVASLPNVDAPFAVVFAARPGADPETMATSVAAPLERRLGEIPGVDQLISLSSIGNTSVIVGFDVDKSPDTASHDVQAALNAAAVDLPSDLPNPPYFRKFNPAAAPVLTIALTSDKLTPAQVYDAADNILGQRLSQVDGIGQVQINGAVTPAVRIRVDPVALAAAGLAMQDVFNAVRSANINQPTGSFSGPDSAEAIAVNSQLSRAAQYAPLILRTNNGAVLRLSDVASVIDGVANTRLAAWNGKDPAILVQLTKTAGANVIDTVDRVRALLPTLIGWLPVGIRVSVISDQTSTIRASFHDVQWTFLVTVALVLMVMVVFMRRLVPTIAAGVTVPLSIGGTLAGMWFLGYTLDNFSLLALTISIGFVVDDAIVMIENIVRQMERGIAPLPAAIMGARQIGFTVMSISVSLVAVFIPLLFMGGFLGRLLREFSMTLTLAIATSAAVSLTLTPMMVGRLMRPLSVPTGPPGFWRRLDRRIERGLGGLAAWYEGSLTVALTWRKTVLLVMAVTIGATIWLYGVVPKDFLPIQDTGLLQGSTVAAPDISFQAMSALQRKAIDIVLADPAVASVASTVGVVNGFSSLNRGFLNVQLKPLDERGVSSEAVIARLRERLGRVAGLETDLYSAQDLRPGGNSGGSQFQFVLLDQDLGELRDWSARLAAKLRTLPNLADVASDQDKAAPEADVEIDREAAARLGVSVAAIDNALNNAFSQRQISTIYTERNQYRVVLEVPPAAQTDEGNLSQIYVGVTNGAQVPLSAVTRVVHGFAPLSVHHQGQFPAATLSFNVKEGTALSSATDIVLQAARDLGMPESVRTQFAGNAQLLQKSLATEPLLILAAFVTIYIVLGVLYESLIHPLTILSTLPSAGLGALLAILLTGGSFSVMSVIGIVLLMGIVKKNGIMLVDFALEAEREQGLPPEDAIRLACVERFRPIVMTTLAALLGALPLALAFGTGSEFRVPLGVAICGGLVVSQMLTLYTTPVIYLALERLASRRTRRRARPFIPIG
jgi:multidrug efflux pump